MTHAPKGWRCTLPDGHDGPCPLWPKGWRRIYWSWKFRHWIVKPRHVLRDNDCGCQICAHEMGRPER